MFRKLGMFDRSLGMFQPPGSIPFQPGQLFAAGEQGAWYDPSDLSTMFQDSAGTIPVTVAGQPVGLIRDKSGRNNNASQTTTTSRPILRQDESGRYYLEFDGTDDWLEASGTVTSWKWIHDGTRLSTCHVACRFGTVADPESIYTIAGTTATVIPPTGWFLAHDTRSSLSRDNVLLSIIGGATDARVNNVQTANSTPANTNLIATCISDPANATAANRSFLRTNLNAYQNNGTGTSALSTGDARNVLQLGAAKNSSNAQTSFFSGRLYGFVLRDQRSTESQIEQTIRWLAGKSGVSL